MEDFPPNSRKSKEEQRPRVEKVVSTDATRRKPGLGKQFKSTFFGGDAQTAMQYVILNVVIPAVKDLMAEAASSGIERLIYGESRPGRRRFGGPPSGSGGVVNYQKMSGGAPRQQSISSQARARHDFDEIVLSSRSEADEVLERLYDILSQFEVATVADLYALTGIKATHTDQKWGWTDLHGSHVERLRNGGYLLDLPDPDVID